MKLCFLTRVCALMLVAAVAAADSEPAGTVPDPLFDDPLFDEPIEFDETEVPVGFPDPWEAGNRPVLAFNSSLDRYLLNPVVRGYQMVVPSPVRKALRRFVHNVDSAPIFMNDVLQLEWKDASVTAGRFVVNSTLGLGGFFDPASSMGLPRHTSDFGQTLALAGTPSGNYVMLPFFGPNTVRDSVGGVVDLAMHPIFWVFGPIGLAWYGGGVGITTKDEYIDALTSLEDSSVDYYAVLRNVYFQNRMDEIWGRRQDRRPAPLLPEATPLAVPRE